MRALRIITGASLLGLPFLGAIVMIIATLGVGPMIAILVITTAILAVMWAGARILYPL